MTDLHSTPEFVSRVYETMKRNLRVVRKKLDRPLTLADKILLSHLDDPENQEMIPGKSVVETLYQALNQSGKGILVVSPRRHSNPTG